MSVLLQRVRRRRTELLPSNEKKFNPDSFARRARDYDTRQETIRKHGNISAAPPSCAAQQQQLSTGPTEIHIRNVATLNENRFLTLTPTLMMYTVSTDELAKAMLNGNYTERD